MVSIFASREFAFVYCIIGTLSQTAHTYYLIESISSLTGILKILQAAGLSIFISSSLLFFTAIADNDEDSPDYRRIHLGVNLFMIIEIIINTYYYATHLIIQLDTISLSDWINFIFALLVSCLIPVTIKLYAGIIKAKEWLELLQEKEKETEAESEIEAESTKEIEPSNESESKPEPIKIISEKNSDSENILNSSPSESHQSKPINEIKIVDVSKLS